MTAPATFRTRFSFVCDDCDVGYRAGRLAGYREGRRLICAACLLGADPDITTANLSGKDTACPPPQPQPAPAPLHLFP